MSEDINLKPYHDGTLSKLKIFELYLEEWLPVYLKTPACTKVNIIDFFAGSGTDSQGQPGSPLVILKTLEKFDELISKENLKIDIIINERKRDKFDKLSKVLNRVCHKNVKITLYNKDFSDLFDELKESLKHEVNLIFIDQYGIKQVTQDRFLELCKFKRTDFIFFISSSYVKRFIKRPEFKQYLGWMNAQAFDNLKHHEVHKEIANQYRKLADTIPDIQLIPFTIKKDQNIYGLIFCCQNIRGAEKFLNVAWKMNAANGSANFDIDDDHSKAQLDMFNAPKLTKLEKFALDIEKLIFEKLTISNKEVYEFTIANGFLPKHANEIVKKLRDENKINRFSNAYIGFKQCYKDRKVVLFTKRH